MNCAKALIATLRKPPELKLINAASYLSQLLGELENTLQVFNKGGKAQDSDITFRFLCFPDG